MLGSCPCDQGGPSLLTSITMMQLSRTQGAERQRLLRYLLTKLLLRACQWESGQDTWVGGKASFNACTKMD